MNEMIQPLNKSFTKKGKENQKEAVVAAAAAAAVVGVCWLPNVPPTCECISGTNLFRQFYVLPH